MKHTQHTEMNHWKIIPGMERYIINKDGEIRNRFTKSIIHARTKDKGLVSLTLDTGERTTRSPKKLVREIFKEIN